MRILWISPGFAAHENDVNCIPPLQLLARALLRRGISLQIIALQYPFAGKPYAWPEEAPQALILPCNGQNRRWLRWRTHMRALRFAHDGFRDKPFDAVHSFWLGPAWMLGKTLARRWAIPHWTTLMGQDVLPQNRYLRYLKPQDTTQLVALTPFHNDMLEKVCGLQAAHCIPWALEREALVSESQTGRSVDLLGVGSLVPVKNWARWLQVVRLVADRHPGLRAELIGEGPERNALEERAIRLGLGHVVSFSGNLPRHQVLERMRASRVLLHTARFESFGFVLAEAAAQGCRIVSTPVGAAPEIGFCSDTDSGLAEAAAIALAAPEAPAKTPSTTMEDVASAYWKLYTL